MVNLQAVGGMEDFNMMSHILREARKYEETMEKIIAKDARPDFHLSVCGVDERSKWIFVL